MCLGVLILLLWCSGALVVFWQQYDIPYQKIFGAYQASNREDNLDTALQIWDVAASITMMYLTNFLVCLLSFIFHLIFHLYSCTIKLYAVILKAQSMYTPFQSYCLHIYWLKWQCIKKLYCP